MCIQNNAAVSPPPNAVEQAVIDALRLISRNPDVNMWSKLDAALPQVKAEFAPLADCDADEIALNRNTSEGLGAAMESMEVCVPEQGLAVMNADRFEETVAVKEASIEDRDLGVLSRDEASVEVNDHSGSGCR